MNHIGTYISKLMCSDRWQPFRYVSYLSLATWWLEGVRSFGCSRNIDDLSSTALILLVVSHHVHKVE